MLSELEKLLLFNFDETFKLDDCCPEYAKHLYNAEWEALLSNNVLKTLIDGGVKSSSIENLVEKDSYEILAIAVACINIFCEINWTGPKKCLSGALISKWPRDINAVEELAIDGEDVRCTILYPELLKIAMELLKVLPSNLVCTWWRLRFYTLYQKSLEELSPSILKVLEDLTKRLIGFEEQIKDSGSRAILNLELNQVYLMFGRVQDAEKSVQKAKDLLDFKLELKGALGKRTKFQQEAVAQLNLDVTVRESPVRLPASITHARSHLPTPCKLNDDVRLEGVQYVDIKDNLSTDLTSVEQLVCLNTIQYLQRSQPKDDLANEELFPYIDLLLAQDFGPWTARIWTLLLKCKLESNNKRTVERAMMQCEEIVKSFSQSLPTVLNRLPYIWATGLPFAMHWRSQLADLLLSIGLIKAALDIYLELQLWEEVIVCYTLLELRHKAAEIIKQQIDTKPTVKLYCLLGDATDDVTMYEKAWDFSQQRSSRAQRHWGNFLFSQKKYEECIPHYQKSCEINSLQEAVWLRLGYAALCVENWEVSANAYRRYTYLEPNSFEAWNNLAKVYVKQGNKERAHRALNEALKYNYDNWQVWENVLIVSLDTGHFDDVIRSYHRILDLRNKHLDVEVLTLLVKAVLQNTIDADGNPAERLKPKVLTLFGRLTSIHSTDSSLWQLYADVSPNALLKTQRLLKSHALLTQILNWGIDPVHCEKVYNIAESIALNILELKDDNSDANKSQITDAFSSSRLTIQTVVRVMTKEKLPQFEDKIPILQSYLEEITSILKKRMSR